MEEFNGYIKNLSKLISVRSVLDAPKKDMPFGEGVSNALNCFLDIAKDLGFNAINREGYIGEIEYGEGEEIGIIGHIDVVPEGTGWKTNPYELTEKDGVYYGRGVLDDKGPLLLSLYALKELKDSGIKPNKKFKFYVGTNEETGWKDVEYYKNKYGFCEYGFSPDGDFPVCYAEKGRVIVKYTLPKLKKFDNVNGGTVINAVCGKAFATDKKSGKIIEKVGKSCHGAYPEKGINAIKLLYEYFLDNGEDVKNILDYFFYDKANIFKMESEQGNVTFSPDLIEEDENGIYLYCDCRYPYPIEIDELKKKFDLFGYKYELLEKHPSLYVDVKSELVDTLIKAYNEITKENAKPISQSGSTFARVFSKGVAFGPEFKNMPSTIHEPNECVDKEQILKMYEIYKKAIFDLAK